jgi:MFS family permease
MPFYVIFVQLPQRFQNVNFTSAERAGILLLPVAMLVPLGSMLAGLAAKKIPIELVLIASASSVCLGVGLLSSLPTYSHLWPGTYGYEIITGTGLGLASPPYFMLVATSVRNKEMAVGTGALNMARTLGGCVAIAICSAIHQQFLSDRLSAILSPAQLAAVQKSGGFIAQLPKETRDRVGDVFGRSYNRQFQVMLAFAGLNVVVVVVLALVRKKMGVFGTMPVREEENEFTRGRPAKSELETSIEDPDVKDTAATQSLTTDKKLESVTVLEPVIAPEKSG